MAISTTFKLSSAAFSEGGTIPKKYSCDGEDMSPPLSWSGAPDKTASYTLVVEDPDARGFVHWVVWDIPGGPGGELAEGVSKTSSDLAQGRNDFGRNGYGGPCPPSGSHRYTFTLYALDARLGLSGTPNGSAVRSAISGHTIGEARLTASYRRGG